MRMVRARDRWWTVSFGVARAGAVGLFLVAAPGCANIWGFQDLSVAADASVDGPGVASADGAPGVESSTDGTVPPPEDDGGPGCVRNSILSCGTCGAPCDTANSLGATCNGVSCSYLRCADGWEDCDQSGTDSNGCETQTNTVAHCGGCQGCDTAHSIGASCQNGSCQYTGCKLGWADCNADRPDTDGCETPVTNDNCQVCNAQGCDDVHSHGGNCVVGDAGATCKYSGCDNGFADCNPTPPDIHGCDTWLFTTANCGACGRACDTKTSNGASCSDAGTCQYAGCAPNWTNCDTSGADSNGCETSLLSIATCGACTGAACDTMTGMPSCDGTTCSYRCKPGRADCNAATAPDTDGCECATPGCCAGHCEISHANGAGGTFYDCAAQKTYDSDHATEACKSTGAVGCLQSNTCCGLLNALGLCVGTPTYSVCGMKGGQCLCWQYQGGQPGTVQTTSASKCSAQCPGANDSAWN
jgi:hypothetical protein